MTILNHTRQGLPKLRVAVMTAALVLLLAGCSSLPQAQVVDRPLSLNMDALKPYFETNNTDFPGVFVSRNDHFLYLDCDNELPLDLEPGVEVLGIYKRKVLVSDRNGSYWFDHSNGSLQPISEIPRIVWAVMEGDTILAYTGAPWQAYLWKSGEPPVALDKPDCMSGIAGGSISPDERYAVIAYDRYTSDGAKGSEVWVYDTMTGETSHWSRNAENLDGLYYVGVMGWSDNQTIRLWQGNYGNFVGLTWVLPSGKPESDHHHFSMMGSGLKRFGHEKWVLYGPNPYNIVIQSVGKGSNASTAISAMSGSVYCHPMVNGNLAVSVYNGNTNWYELKADGTLKHWSGIEILY